MNIELRTKILEKSLNLEDNINRCLRVLIEVKSSQPKTIGDKSSSIPLASKINLLLDLELLNKEEYNQLFCFLEIRNQFMHNIHCDSYIKVIEKISRSNLLLKLDSKLTEFYENPILIENREEYIKLMVDNLGLRVLEIAINLHKKSIDKLENKMHNSQLGKMNSAHKEGMETFRNLLKINSESVQEVLAAYSKSEKEEFNVDESLGDFLQKEINITIMEKTKESFPELYEEVMNKNDH